MYLISIAEKVPNYLLMKTISGSYNKNTLLNIILKRILIKQCQNYIWKETLFQHLGPLVGVQYYCIILQCSKTIPN